VKRETISPSHERLAGWIRSRLRAAPGRIWLAVDVVEFCEFVGLSERTGRYALERLRSEAEDRGLKFRTVFKREHGAKGAWRVLVTEERRLDYDREPLFRDHGGRSRHLRPKMTEEELRPENHGPRINGEGRGGGAGGDHSGEAAGAGGSSFEARSPCNSYKGGFPTETQQQNKHPASGGSGVEAREGPRWERREMTAKGRSRLRAKAGAITRRLSALWWDNCKVEDPVGKARAALVGFVFRHLVEGRTEAAIRSAVDKALHRLHGTATDRGERFGIASTLARADSILAKDQRIREERVGDFYRERSSRWREYCALREAEAEALNHALHRSGVPFPAASGRDALAVEGVGDFSSGQSCGDAFRDGLNKVDGKIDGRGAVGGGELLPVLAELYTASLGGGEGRFGPL
jgi:hypothetical protein